MVQERRAISVKVEQEVVGLCALSNGNIVDDLQWP